MHQTSKGMFGEKTHFKGHKNYFWPMKSKMTVKTDRKERVYLEDVLMGVILRLFSSLYEY